MDSAVHLVPFTAAHLDDFAAERLTLLIEVANTRVAERCGYVLEGVRRNAYVKPGIRGHTAVYARLR